MGSAEVLHLQSGVPGKHCSLRLAAEKRSLIEKLNKEADDIEANIKAVDDKLTIGCWECENGHEIATSCGCASPGGPAFVHIADCVFNGFNAEACPGPGCNKPMKLFSLATMTGHEKYESDKERKEAQTIAENKRATAKAEAKNAEGSEKTAKYFQDQARNNRAIAEKIRSL